MLTRKQLMLSLLQNKHFWEGLCGCKNECYSTCGTFLYAFTRVKYRHSCSCSCQV